MILRVTELSSLDVKWKMIVVSPLRVVGEIKIVQVKYLSRK